MSYILEALRRADSERERGAVPGLHTRADPRVAAEAQSPQHGARWRWVVIGLAAGLAVPLAWNLIGGSDTTNTAAVPAQQERVEAPAPQPAPVQQPARVAAAPAQNDAAPVPQPAAAEAPAPQRAAPAEAPPQRRTAAAPRPQQRAAESPPREAAAPQAPADNAPDGRIYAAEELPDEIRRALPQLAIGGSIYSPDPSSRFLIINGQTFRERDIVAPETSLEQIRLKTAVLKFRGYRYRLNY